MWLHENREDFFDAVNLAAEKFGILPTVVEKDYYVTMILRELSHRLDYVVFKGGTSLAKCHKVVKRFSEDIDITIDKRLSQGQMRKLKEVIKSVTEELRLRIPNIDDTRSRRNYNRYILEYDTVLSDPDEAVQTAVLLETSFVEVSFPTVLLPVHSYVGDMLLEEAPERMEEYQLDLFDMKVQDIDRTLIDKVFAICDYYMQNKVRKHSRHIYDIYKLKKIVPMTDAFKKLVADVRVERARTDICPSAQQGVDIPEMLRDIVKSEVYKEDYETITVKLLEEHVPYETVIEAVKAIAATDIFRE